MHQISLLTFAREAADFATEGRLPTLDYAADFYGQPDVALFDFTSLFSAENASRLFERNGSRLLAAIVGDSLHEVGGGREDDGRRRMIMI